MWSGSKADQLHCLESDLPERNHMPFADAIIIDGAALVQMLNPGTSNTFQEYAENVFAPPVSALVKRNHHVDLVWDIYLAKA